MGCAWCGARLGLLIVPAKKEEGDMCVLVGCQPQLRTHQGLSSFVCVRTQLRVGRLGPSARAPPLVQRLRPSSVWTCSRKLFRHAGAVPRADSCLRRALPECFGICRAENFRAAPHICKSAAANPARAARGCLCERHRRACVWLAMKRDPNAQFCCPLPHRPPA